MKHAVDIRLESTQTDEEGRQASTSARYAGHWYHQDKSDYLVYEAEGITTTLRWNAQEWQLIRRGPELESFQLFRPGAEHLGDLRLAGGVMPMETVTHDLQARPTPEGIELHMTYTLQSGEESLGTFALVFHVSTLDQP